MKVIHFYDEVTCTRSIYHYFVKHHIILLDIPLNNKFLNFEYFSQKVYSEKFCNVWYKFYKMSINLPWNIVCNMYDAINLKVIIFMFDKQIQLTNLLINKISINSIIRQLFFFFFLLLYNCINFVTQLKIFM